MTIESVQFDWRGMRCPEPILKTAREIRQLRDTPTSHVHVLADDDAFPMDIERWCKSSGVTLGELIEHEDGFEAILVLQGEYQARPSRKTVPQESASADSVEPTERLDCIGLCCPEPIMKTARAVRKMESGILEVIADDDAFPKDLEAWVRNSKAELISIDAQPEGVRALLRVGGAGDAEQPSTSFANGERPSSNGGGNFANAQKALARGLTYPGTGGVASEAPSQQERTSQLNEAIKVTAMPKGSAGADGSSSGMHTTPMTQASMVLYLDDAPKEQRLGRVKAMGGPQWCGEKIGVMTRDRALFQDVIAWSARTGQTLLHVDATHGELVFEVGFGDTSEDEAALAAPSTTAMVKAEPKRATYLVIHNDFESLMAAMMVANTAAVQGMETTIFFSFWGVNLLRGDQQRSIEPDGKLTFIHRLFRMMMPRGPKRQPLSKMHFGGMGKSMMLASMKQQNVMSLESLVDAAVDNGVKFLVCTMSMNIMGIHKRDIIDLPNIEFAGVASFVADSADSDASMVF